MTEKKPEGLWKRRTSLSPSEAKERDDHRASYEDARLADEQTQPGIKPNSYLGRKIAKQGKR